METDASIQHLTRQLDATVLVIAHRLDTVLGLDRVLVMENGTIVEDDTPKNLMANTQSKFRQMVIQAQNNEETQFLQQKVEDI